jgi:uncharacterized membrane protein YwzB
MRLVFFIFFFIIISLSITKLGSSFFVDLFEAPQKLVLYIIDSAYYS